MEMRFLGKSGLQVSVLGFGAMTFGNQERFKAIAGADQDTATRQIDMCIEAGVNFFDTANIYCTGQSEEMLGRALGARRKDVLIATKAFNAMGPGPFDVGLSRRALIDACDASLKRLGTDWIDLYQVHNFDSLVPVEETLGALDDLVRAGKVRYIGCSNHTAWQLMKALNISERHHLERYISQQIQYSLLVRDAEHELLPAGVDQGVGAIIWSPLAMGYLSGKWARQDAQTQSARLANNGGLAFYDSAQGRAVVEKLLEIATNHQGATASQVALNWVAARAGVSTILVGARDEAQLADNLKAATWTISAEEVAELDRVSQKPLPYPLSSQRLIHPERNPLLFPRYK